MPTDADIDNQIVEEQPEAAPVAAPTPVVDESKIAAGIVAGLRELQLERDAAMRANQSAPQEEREVVINDDDTPAMIAQKAAYNAGIPLRRQMAAMQDQFQRVGMGTLEQVSRATVLDNDPTYKKYKAEVDQRLSSLDSVARANPSVLREVVKMVKADHVDEIAEDIAKRAVAAALKSGEGAAPSMATSRYYRQAPANVPTPEDLGFSEDQIDTIMRRGGLDHFARNMSGGRYNGWEDYAKAKAKHSDAIKNNKSDYKGVSGQAVPINFTRAGKKK